MTDEPYDFEYWEINPQYHLHGLELVEDIDCTAGCFGDGDG